MNRLRAGNKPRVLDLFAGCGGLSLGFYHAGFDIAGAVEFDKIAAKSHALNFCKTASTEEQDVHATARDITKISPEDLVKELKLGETCSAIDVLIGGPPCQAFARIGRAKLREIKEHPEAFRHDERAVLYVKYLEYVQKIQPVAILMENVPDILNFGGQNIAEEICDALTRMGYDCRYTLLNSAYYGVPQMRERLFLLAYTRELGQIPHFPEPTHWVNLPRGYYGSRQVALKSLEGNLFGGSNYYVEAPKTAEYLKPAVTASEALKDLPKLTFHLTGQMKKAPQKFTQLLPYGNTNPSEYGKLMREWKGFENPFGIKDHVIRYLPRDYIIFRKMKAGDQYPEAYQVAMSLFQKKLNELKNQGIYLTEDSVEYNKLKREIVPPYDPNKFPNKWRKMEPDWPARTLMAHLGKDGYSHIHYDSEQARTISVREAARLQSFPDGFVFSGSMNAAFRQIGNAVPPLMSWAIAKEIHIAIKEAYYFAEAGIEASYSI